MQNSVQSQTRRPSYSRRDYRVMRPSPRPYPKCGRDNHSAEIVTPKGYGEMKKGHHRHHKLGVDVTTVKSVTNIEGSIGSTLDQQSRDLHPDHAHDTTEKINGRETVPTISKCQEMVGD